MIISSEGKVGLRKEFGVKVRGMVHISENLIAYTHTHQSTNLDVKPN